ncbi:MAG: hypothetical protein HAW62_05715 [Endozoicomonadaceae bacterium]|nr:hypothetical protein [Endozoicomonadaceae bacterium]
MEKCSQNQQYVGNSQSIADSAMQSPSIEQPSVKKFGREASPMDMEAEQTNFMEKTAANNHKRKLNEDDDLLPIRRLCNRSVNQKAFSLKSLNRDLAEMKKSAELLIALDFSLYGLSATKPVVNKDEAVNADIACQRILKIIDFHQNILDQISCISSKQRKALDETLLSKGVSKNTFIKNIRQIIYSLNMLDMKSKTISTGDTDKTLIETSPSTLTDLLDEMPFLMI